jgi:hypothetical protein
VSADNVAANAQIKSCAPDDLPHIFERYYRAESGRVRAVRGNAVSLIAHLQADHFQLMIHTQRHWASLWREFQSIADQICEDMSELIVVAPNQEIG